MDINVWTQYKYYTENDIVQSLLQEEIDQQSHYREQISFACVVKKRIKISCFWGIPALGLLLVHMATNPLDRNIGGILPTMMLALIWLIRICVLDNKYAAKYLARDAVKSPDTPFSQLVAENIQEQGSGLANSKMFHVWLCLAVIMGNLVIPITDQLSKMRVDGMIFKPYQGGCVLVDCEADFTTAHVVIPEQVEGETVIAIHSGAFMDERNIVSVTIPNTVTSIGAKAFSGCTKLESIVIPERVSEIRGNCFENCRSLKQVELHEGITSIHSYAFRNCSSLEKIMLPSGITEIGGYCFESCVKLNSIVIPKCVTEIRGNCFENCSSLKRVVLHEGITSIHGYAFRNCSSLEKIMLPSGITEIGGYCFESCVKLNSIVIPKGVTEIRGNCFENCSSLKQVVLHEGITSIHGYAFRNCSSLEQIALPSGITEIRGYCFENCVKLKSIVIPEGVTRIGAHAFMGCEALESVTVPPTVREIGSSAFRQCTTLKTIDIPKEAVIEENSFKESPTEVIRFAFTAEQIVEIEAELLSRKPDVVYFFYEKDAGIHTVFFPYTERVIVIADDTRFSEYLDIGLELHSMENYAEILNYLEMAQNQGAEAVKYQMYTQIGSDIKGKPYFCYIEYSVDEMIRRIKAEMAGE